MRVSYREFQTTNNTKCFVNVPCIESIEVTGGMCTLNMMSGNRIQVRTTVDKIFDRDESCQTN